jgi:hypothetical protein
VTTEQIAARTETSSRLGLGAPRRWGLLVLGFLLPALLIYAPALPHFGTTIPGGPTAQKDGWQNVWNLWWTAEALRSGRNPLRTNYLYYPEGIGLFWQTLNVTNGLLAFPVTLAAGPVAAYNLLALASFVLAGLTMFWLARALGASQPAAFVAGLLYSFAPLHVARLVDGQLEHLSIQWLPLYALLLRAALEQGRRLAALGAGLLLLWITYTSLYQGLACLLLLAVYALVLLVRERSWANVRQLAIGGAVVLLVWIVPLTPQLVGASSRGGPDHDWLDSQRLHSATPLDFGLPNPNHPLWGQAVSSLGQALHPDAGSWNVALGLGLLALAGLALLGSPPARREPWPWVALLCVVLALGPELKLGGQATGLPLPYALLNSFPPVRLGQRPNYLALVALLALALVAARGVDLLLRRYPHRRGLLLAGLGVLLACELMPRPLALTDPGVQPIFEELADDQEPGAVLELPFLPESSEPLKAQLVHGRPIMGGFVSRTPAYPFPVERPALQALWTGEEPAELAGPLWYEAAGDTFDFYGIRYVVVRWRPMAPEQRAALSTRFSAIPQGVLQQIYDFQGLSVYKVTNRRPPQPFLYQRGLYPAERDRQRAWQWMGQEAALVLVNPTGEQRGALVKLRTEAFRVERELLIELERAGRAREPLATLRMPTWPSERHLRIVLPPGETTLHLRSSAEAAAAPDTRRLSLVFTQLEVRWADPNRTTEARRHGGTRTTEARRHVHHGGTEGRAPRRHGGTRTTEARRHVHHGGTEGRAPRRH